MENLNFLAKVPIFSLMKKEDLMRISKAAKIRMFRNGEIIIREDDNDKKLFIIISGSVEIIKNLGTKKETFLEILGPQSYFGEFPGKLTAAFNKVLG